MVHHSDLQFDYLDNPCKIYGLKCLYFIPKLVK